MSPQHPSNQVADSGVSAKDARAQAKSEKAYRKALRPWFKKKRFIIPLALILVIALAMAFGGGAAESPGSTSQPADQQGQVAQQEAAEAGIGTPVRDGAFEFTVGKPQDMGTTIGSGPLAATAQGKFVVIPVDVKNIGNEARTLEASSQKLMDTQGREFNSSHEFGALPNADKVFLQNINPGNTVSEAPLLFDVPEDVELASLELHDSMFSGGVKVSLK